MIKGVGGDRQKKKRKNQQKLEKTFENEGRIKK